MVAPISPDRMARLPLRAELYLIAHDDDSGQPHLHEGTLGIGLAGAILLELWLARRIVVGWAPDGAAQQWVPAPGVITVRSGQPLGDPLSDAAMAAIEHTRHAGGAHLRTWMRAFGGGDMYQRVQASMIAAGVLRRGSYRRYGLVKSDCFLALHESWVVRVRASIRGLVHGVQVSDRAGLAQADEQAIALCGLVDVLELTPFLLHPSLSDNQLRQILRMIVNQHVAERQDGSLIDVIAAIDAGRGDLAVAAMG